MPVALVYAIWSGLGIVCIAGHRVFRVRAKVDLAPFWACRWTSSGVLVIHLWSNISTIRWPCSEPFAALGVSVYAQRPKVPHARFISSVWGTLPILLRNQLGGYAVGSGACLRSLFCRFIFLCFSLAVVPHCAGLSCAAWLRRRPLCRRPLVDCHSLMLIIVVVAVLRVDRRYAFAFPQSTRAGADCLGWVAWPRFCFKDVFEEL